MVPVCNLVRGVCGIDFDTCKNRYRGSKFQSRHGDTDGCGRYYGVGIAEISRKSWTFLILSGLATGASWLCYYHALQIGEASKVVPIDKLSVVITLILAFVFLHEEFTARSVIGCVLIGAGTLVMVI